MTKSELKVNVTEPHENHFSVELEVSAEAVNQVMKVP